MKETVEYNMIWKKKLTQPQIQQLQEDTMLNHLGIKVLEIGNDYVLSEMPIDTRTVQPQGILHGGASAALSESMGSIASSMCINMNEEIPVGIEINANHLRQGRGEKVTAKTTPIKIGRKIHVWNTEIFDQQNKLLCVSRLTVMIIKKN